MPHVVQFDRRKTGRRGQLFEPARDRIGMRWPAVLPAEQHAMIVVVRPEIPALLVERFDVGLQRGQSERVERQHVLSVFGLAIRLDDPAIYDDAGYLDRESPGVQVEQVNDGRLPARSAACPKWLRAPTRRRTGQTACAARKSEAEPPSRPCGPCAAPAEDVRH